MAQYRLNAYDADVFIPEFKGLMQYGDQMGTDLRFSPDCMNVETPGGVLQPAPGMRSIPLYTADNVLLKNTYNNREVAIMNARMVNTGDAFYSSYQIYHYSSGDQKINHRINNGDEYSAYLIIVQKDLYEVTVYASSAIYYNDELIHEGDRIRGLYVTKIKEFTYGDFWSWCVYEKTENNQTSNVIILTSPYNGTYMYTGNGQITEISSAPSNMKYVTVYAERIWGCGSPNGENKDHLYYSRPYDATDWTEAGPDEQPEDGGGEIREATFDKDEIVALVPFGDSLIAFSKMRAWRITGSDPSSFYIQEQYGNGTQFPYTIAVMEDRVLMLGNGHLLSYDGNRVTPFYEQCTYEILREGIAHYETPEWEVPIARVVGSKYVLMYHKTEPTSTGTVRKNTYYLVYDSTDGTFTVYNSPYLIDACKDEPFMWSIGFIDDGTSGDKAIKMFLFQSDSFNGKSVSGAATKWTTPWIDLGRKDIQKGGFELYFYPELNTDDPTATVTLKFTIQTEKKKKSKSYVVHALTSDERTADKKHKQKRLHFGGAGRRFRLTIETAAGNTVPWRLIGGIHIIAEIDKD